MKVISKIEKAIVFTLRNIISPISPSACTRFMVWFYKRKGMRILGQPLYLAGTVYLDGTTGLTELLNAAECAIREQQTSSEDTQNTQD